jgi:hypothetical protein
VSNLVSDLAVEDQLWQNLALPGDRTQIVKSVYVLGDTASFASEHRVAGGLKLDEGGEKFRIRFLTHNFFLFFFSLVIILQHLEKYFKKNVKKAFLKEIFYEKSKKPFIFSSK